MTVASDLALTQGSARRFSRTDVVLLVAAFAIGSFSLAFPLGSDQAIHYYVGREWLHGAIPYRDTFDYKTPGIFVVHAIVIALFGEQTWGIRFADLVCVLSLGALLHTFVERRVRGTLGFVCFVTSFVYYGYFSFWDTAQCELFATTFAVASVVAARTSASVAGVLAGLAFLMKPPGIVLALPAFVACARVSWRGAVAFGAGACAPLVTTLLYFEQHSATPALREILIGANTQYVIGARRVDTPGELFEQVVDMVSWFQPFGALLLGGAIGAVLRRRASAIARAPLVFGGLALIAIAAQLKFFGYHYALLVPAIVLGIVHVTTVTLDLAVARAIPLVLILYALAGAASRHWLSDHRAALAYVTGRLTRSELASRFAIPSLAFSERDVEDAGEWVRSQTTERDTILVRGFQPGVYVYARRRAPGRFFWTGMFIDSKRQFHRDAWLAEDARAVATLPRFVVTRVDALGPDAPARFTEMGYTPCREFGKLAVLGHGPSACGLSR